MPNDKVPPFLELSHDTLQQFDTSGLDLENVLAVWAGLTKCSGFIKNGKRLENISWRIVNRNLVIKEDSATIPHKQGAVPSSLGKTRNKLNDGDLFSLLSIVSQQNVHPLSSQLTKRKSSGRNLPRRANNRSSESLNRPSVFRKTSSSKSLKKLNQKNKKSSTDLSSIPNDTDMFEQPHPRYAFGIYDEPSASPKNEQVQHTGLTRSDTFTSVIRGFDPNEVPSTAVPPKTDTHTQHEREEEDLRSDIKPHPQTQSLFASPQPQPAPSQTQQTHAKEEQQKGPTRAGTLFANQYDRVRSPLSHESTSDVLKGKETHSLFGNNNQQKRFSLFDQHPTSSKSSLLFDNVKKSSPQPHHQPVRSPSSDSSNGSSVQLLRPQPKKRNSVLNNLGMTSLSRPGSNDSTREKKMFFIESSPSPTDPKMLDSHNLPQQKLNLQRHHHGQKRSPGLLPQENNSTTSLFGNQQQKATTSKPSLFEGKKPIREIMFSSDDSMSDESDWSSVSEDLASEDEEDLHDQWTRSSFKRDESLTQKPQIKRSLLSGLFLNEMHQENAIQPPQPVLHSQKHDTHIKSVKSLSKSSSTEANDLLSPSATPSNFVKHRSDPTTDANKLELITSEPLTSISTTHVTASGLLNDSNTTSTTDFKKSLDQQVQPSSSLSQLTKSALHLTNYFSSQRKNSFSSIASDRTRVRFNKHESNAPPTASTLLPTALSTHMFLPNAHQRAKSRLTSVFEGDSTSEEPSRKNSETGKNLNQLFEKNPTGTDISRTLHSEEPIQSKPIKSPTINIPAPAPAPAPSQHVDDLSNSNNISRRLSPKTTRKQMLATELSDSLRKSILWDRQYAFPGDQQGLLRVVYDGTTKELNEELIDEEKSSQGDKPKVLKKEFQGNDHDWDKESFYARGW